jgi:hypothetical protein
MLRNRYFPFEFLHFLRHIIYIHELTMHYPNSLNISTVLLRYSNDIKGIVYGIFYTSHKNKTTKIRSSTILHTTLTFYIPAI